MKRTIILAWVLAAGVIIPVIAGLSFFLGFYGWPKSQQGLEYLPPTPVAEGISITVLEWKIYNQIAARQFLFKTNRPMTAVEVERLFDTQLVGSGWERMEITSTKGISASSWRHKTLLSGRLQLGFTLLQLDTGNEYLGTMTSTFSGAAGGAQPRAGGHNGKKVP